MSKKQIFISYSAYDNFEADLLQFAIEKLLEGKVTAWTFQRNQKHSEKEIATSLKEKVKESIATVFLLSPSTLKSSATQWMELGYADAFNIATYILLHHLSYDQLMAKGQGIPPFILASQCSPATDWKRIVNEINEKFFESEGRSIPLLPLQTTESKLSSEQKQVINGTNATKSLLKREIEND